MVSTDEDRERRKELARQEISAEMAETFYNERNAAMAEAERQKDRAEKVISVAREVKHVREESLVEMLMGDRYKPVGFEEPSWTQRAVFRVAKNLRIERDSMTREIEEMKKDHLSEKIGVIGGYERIDRVPLIVYHKGEFIYQTESLDKMVRSTYSLESELKDNAEFTAAVKKGKKMTVPYGGGEIVFHAEKLKKHDYVAIGYFVPKFENPPEEMPKGERKNVLAGLRRKEKIFRTQGARAAEAIYKTLKSYENKGMNFINDGNQ